MVFAYTERTQVTRLHGILYSQLTEESHCTVMMLVVIVLILILFSNYMKVVTAKIKFCWYLHVD